MVVASVLERNDLFNIVKIFKYRIIHEFLRCFSGFVPPDQIWPYAENKEKFMITEKIPEDFDEAIQEIEKVIRNRAARAAVSLLYF